MSNPVSEVCGIFAVDLAGPGARVIPRPDYVPSARLDGSPREPVVERDSNSPVGLLPFSFFFRGSLLISRLTEPAERG